MSKLDTLRKLYEALELDNTDDRMLLVKVKNGTATDEEVNYLLESATGKGLDDIKNFENTLVNDIRICFTLLQKIETEANKVAHLDDEKAKAIAYSNMSLRYKKLIDEAEDICEAIVEAYFQVSDFEQYKKDLNAIKENLDFLD